MLMAKITPLLEINDVGKLYRGNLWGLRNFSLRITPGVTGLVGPNGAGKSTLMRILATVTKPTEGRVLWNGIDIADSPNEVRKLLGYLPQDFGIYPNLNAVEFLTYLAAARGISGHTARRRIEELVDVINLGHARKRPLGSLSGGMKQRVGIAQALLNDPELLIVDEPTVGLDPEERIRFRNLLTELSGERIVILSSHIVSDVEAAAVSIAVIQSGHLIVHSAPEELLQTVNDKVWEVIITSSELSDLRRTYVVGSTAMSGEGMRVRVIGEIAPRKTARRVAPTLEDAYLYLSAAKNDKQSHE